MMICVCCRSNFPEVEDALSGIVNVKEMLNFFFFSLQMAATIDMNFQSDLMAIFEENLF